MFEKVLKAITNFKTSLCVHPLPSDKRVKKMQQIWKGGEPETSQGIKPPVKTVDAKSLGQSQGQER